MPQGIQRDIHPMILKHTLEFCEISQWRRKVFIGGVKEAQINNKHI
jgi:hypothetical protein